MKILYEQLCPNCGGEISSERLKEGLPCEKCLEVPVKGIDNVYNELKKKGTLKNFESIYKIHASTKEFREFFKNVLGNEPWSVQISWVKRFFLGKSFCILAPTGVGKTSFGIALASFIAKKGKKTYFVLPTTTLVEQVVKKLKDANTRVAYVHSKMKKKDRADNIEKINKGLFDVLVTTSSFLSKNFELVNKNKFQLIFVDDVDALLRSSKNIERVLMLAGFKEKEIHTAMEIVRLRRLVATGRARPEQLEEKRKSIKSSPHAQVVFSSATGRVRGLRAKAMGELLGFEIGTSRTKIRNVVNATLKRDVVSAVKMLGDGGLVFVPADKGKEYAEEIAERLKREGIKAELATSETATKLLPAFEKREIDVLVGVATYYGVLVRGIDLPERVKYAVFDGVPRFKFKLNLENIPQGTLAFLLDGIASIKNDPKLRTIANRVRRGLDVENARTVLKEMLDEKTLEKLAAEGIAYIEKDSIYVADIKTYIQASGRTSRMYSGGITKGLSIVLVDIPPLFKQLERMLSIYDEYFAEMSEEDILNTIKEISTEREHIRDKIKARSTIKTVLFIVESPNKARTIASFFGTPSRYRIGPITAYETTTGKYVITLAATSGHIFDLTTERGFHGVEGKTPVYTTIKKCRKCGTQIWNGICPVCETDEFVDDAIWRINALRTLAIESDIVLIGTDPDTEGEKIAWDVFLALRPFVNEIYRSEFHEVTRTSVLDALEERKKINESRVNAQIIRRVEDRWIGFELSRKLREEFGSKTLSAGRVQTPVLGWIIERYNEHKESITNFTSVSWENGFFVFEGKSEGRKVEIKRIRTETREINPPPPFTTDSMLQEACSRMGIGADEVMRLAQDLFEQGFITYHRTDSVRVSSAGIHVAEQYIKENFGDEYFVPRKWSDKGAHECIRPVRPIDANTLIRYLREGFITASLRKEHIRLYSIIFRRFMMSQMAPAKVEESEFEIKFNKLKGKVKAFSKIIFPGFMLGEKESQMKEGVFTVKSARHFRAAKVPLFSQADVVARMKERKIGRPSTYATIISKLLTRRYVSESKEKKKLFPTSLGKSVYSFLSSHYSELVSEERTRELEEIMDMVEQGEVPPEKVLDELYAEIKTKVV